MRTRRNAWSSGALALALLLAACGGRPEKAAVTGPSPGWPDFNYAAAAQEQDVFELDAERSRVDVVVRREGPLARFGHDHVIGVRGLEGWIALDGERGRADLRFPADRLEIDAPEARARYALDSEPSPEAVAGTGENLRTRVLQTAEWPWIELALRDIRPDRDAWTARVDITVRGERSTLDRPFLLQRSAAEVIVEGRIDLRQSDLGLTPFSVLGGGLRVANVMEVHYRLQGSRRRDP